MYWDGVRFYAGGTSASTPLIAGLITTLNAALGEPIGFLNPTLYALGNRVCRDINPQTQDPPGGPTNNGWTNDPKKSIPVGYPAGPGWDACTGWGVIDGNKLLCALREIYRHHEREHHEHRSFSGKIERVVYDRFGDFEAFILSTREGDCHRFESREARVQKLVQRACAHRISTTVVVRHDRPKCPFEILLHEALLEE
jgi:hypothetical protein